MAPAGQAPTETPLSALLAQIPLFSALSPEQSAHIAAACRERHLTKGEMLFQKGDPVRGFFIVVTGQMKLALPSAQGNEKVLEIIGPRQSFGEAVMFMDRPFPVSAEALLDTRLLHIARESIFQLLDSDASFARRMLAGLSMRLHALIADVESYSLRSSAQRLIGYLLQQAGDKSGEGHVTIKLPTTKHVLASRLNLTPETFSRVLHDLSSAGLIEVSGRNITIPDLTRLRAHDL